jgi:hypothetical protein
MTNTPINTIIKIYSMNTERTKHMFVSQEDFEKLVKTETSRMLQYVYPNLA